MKEKIIIWIVGAFVIMAIGSGGWYYTHRSAPNPNQSAKEFVENSLPKPRELPIGPPDTKSSTVEASGSSRETESYFGEIRAESQGFGSYKVVGALKGDFKSISVVWRYDGKEDEPYTLKKYIPEKRVFEYYVQPRFKTIQKGENTYIFTWEKANGEKESKEFSINEEHNISIGGKYCLLDLCIDESKPFETHRNVLSQTIKSSEDDGPTTDLTIDLKNGSGSMQESGMMYSLEVHMSRIGDHYIRTSNNSSCGGSSWKQEVLDAKGKTIHGSEQTLRLPKSLHIGNTVFALDDLNADTSTYVYGTLKPEKEIEEKFSINDTAIESKLFTLIKTEKNWFPQHFVLSFREYPTVKVVYTTKTEQPERVVFLGTDQTYLKKNITSDWDLTDKDVSNKILGYYQSDRRLVPEWDMGGQINTVSDSQFPLFRVKKLSDDGYYLLYSKKGYVFQSFAEMCKPVVYTYTKEPKELQVSLDLLGRGFFTKLIPAFSTGNTWNTITSSDGSATVDGRHYDYLYYSLKVKDYAFNTNGWIIRGNEAVGFFDDKLSKIGFRQKEKNDFIEFWKTKFKPNSYYFVSFKYNEDMEKLAKLFFGQAPQSLERVLFEGYEIGAVLPKEKEKYLYQNNRDTFDSKLLRTFKRNADFDVFEWGWVLLDSEEMIIR